MTYADRVTILYFLQIHPFMTMPLALAVDFLIQNQSDNMAASLLHDLLNTLRQLKNINNSHESYVDLLDLNQLVTGVNM